ncbi:MAG: hypothetical protein EZS28_008264 [Streblomastix strix]|uniref:Uncharacterized protein n=1 Tax=Streblomastix strix TaxID=222440 RepID=A0A5J4WNL4_9EUKA|nr:MAG: hypothetical protein EZS28_008264 [Streblomastix strix]
MNQLTLDLVSLQNNISVFPMYIQSLNVDIFTDNADDTPPSNNATSNTVISGQDDSSTEEDADAVIVKTKESESDSQSQSTSPDEEKDINHENQDDDDDETN